jgi:hypothetical protein
MSVAGLIRIISLAFCAVVFASFVLFAVDELGQASADASAAAPAAVARDAHGRMVQSNPIWRVKIDEAADAITSPGENVAAQLSPTPSPWSQRGFALIFGMVVFGLGLRLLASYYEKSAFAQVDDPYVAFSDRTA